MKNTDIQKIRQLLKNGIEALDYHLDYSSSKIAHDGLGEIKHAPALLPCPTCGGTRKTNRICVDIEGVEFVAEKDVPCPDCQF